MVSIKTLIERKIGVWPQYFDVILNGMPYELNWSGTVMSYGDRS